MIRQVAWTAPARAGLARALPPATLDFIEAEVRAGISALWECSQAEHHAYCVTRVDQNPTTFVIVAFEGTGMHLFAPSFIAAAESRNLPMRAHTVSPIVARLIRRYGFRTAEFVCRRERA